MNIGIGTTNLKPELNEEYLKIFNHCLNNSM